MLTANFRYDNMDQTNLRTVSPDHGIQMITRLTLDPNSLTSGTRLGIDNTRFITRRMIKLTRHTIRMTRMINRFQISP